MKNLLQALKNRLSKTKRLEIELAQLRSAHVKALSDKQLEISRMAFYIADLEADKERSLSLYRCAIQKAHDNKAYSETLQVCLRQLVARTRLELIRNNKFLHALVEGDEDWPEITAAIRTLNGQKNQDLN